MSNLYNRLHSKNAVRCAPLVSFKSNEAAFKCGSWFAASLGHQRATKFCEENGIVVQRALSEGVNSAGGVLVPTEFLPDLYSALETRGVVRAAGHVLPISRDVATATKIISGLTASFVAENLAVTPSDPTLSALSFVAKKLSALVVASSELAEDSLIDLGDFLLTLAVYSFADMEDRCGFIGDSTSTYGGITGLSKLLIDGSHTAGAITAATGVDTYAEITITDISNMIGKVRADAIPGAAFFVSQMGFALTMCRLAGANGGIGVVQTPTGPRPSFLGFPIYATAVLSQSTGDLSGATMILFGDLKKAITLADRREPTVSRADLGQKFAEDQIQFRFSERVDLNVGDAGDTSSAGSVVALVGK